MKTRLAKIGKGAAVVISALVMMGLVTLTTSIVIDEIAAPALSAANTAKLYVDSTSHTLKLSLNTGAFSDIITALTGNALYCRLIGCTMTGQEVFSGVATDVSTGTNEDFTMGPAGTGAVVASVNAGGNFRTEAAVNALMVAKFTTSTNASNAAVGVQSNTGATWWQAIYNNTGFAAIPSWANSVIFYTRGDSGLTKVRWDDGGVPTPTTNIFWDWASNTTRVFGIYGDGKVFTNSKINAMNMAINNTLVVASTRYAGTTTQQATVFTSINGLTSTTNVASTGTAKWLITDGTNTCTCTYDCTTAANAAYASPCTNVAGTGCTYAAAVTVVIDWGSVAACTTNQPTLLNATPYAQYH